MAESFAADIKRKMSGDKVSYRRVAANLELDHTTIAHYVKLRREPQLVPYIKLCQWLGKPFEFYIAT